MCKVGYPPDEVSQVFLHWGVGLPVGGQWDSSVFLRNCCGPGDTEMLLNPLHLRPHDGTGHIGDKWPKRKCSHRKWAFTRKASIDSDKAIT